MQERGILMVVSGPAGVGKGTIVKLACQKAQGNIHLSVSATTRNPRPIDKEGVTYHFITKEEFRSMIEQNEVLEWAEYVGNYYGTPKDYVDRMLSEGKNVILEIEMQGGLKVKEQCPEAVLIFMVPPSAEELKNRLIGRGTEDIETVNKRLRRASEEIDYIDDYDYIVVNNEIEKCADDINAIICSEHNKVLNNSDMISIIKDDFKLLK